MPLDNGERAAVLAALMRSHNVGTVTKPSFLAAVAATDDWIEANQGAYVLALPDPFRSFSTVQDKTILFCYVALKRAGLLPDEGV